MTTQMDLFDARMARDEGMARVELSVNTQYPGWSDEALGLLKAFLNEIGFREFQAEDFKVWGEPRGLRIPVNSTGKTAWRVLGPLFLKAKKERLISFVRIEPTKGVTAHRANASVYVKCSS